MQKHADHCTHVWFAGESVFLHSKLFDVNMRLFRSSPGYKAVVLAACAHIQWCATTEKEGYKKPDGWSGANAGIPWNIIALADGTVMINPTIVSTNGLVTVNSNCGSLTLFSPIRITRHKWVMVKYFSMSGVEKTMAGKLFTVQHEIEHNLGILITDKQH